MTEQYICPHCKERIIPDLVQLKNPVSHRWVVVDRSAGAIIKHSRTSTPYKHITMVIADKTPRKQPRHKSERRVGKLESDLGVK